MGLFGLGPGQTILVLAAITAPLFATAAGPGAFLAAAAPALLVLGLLLLRWDGVPVVHALVRRWRWLTAGRARTGYHAPVLTDPAHAPALPGVLAGTRLMPVTDPAGGDFALVWNRRLGTMTAALRVAATSTWLADPPDAEAWVANWGQWLAGLGYQPMIRQAAVIVETAPDPGAALSAYLGGRIAPTPHRPPGASWPSWPPPPRRSPPRWTPRSPSPSTRPPPPPGPTPPPRRPPRSPGRCPA
jgi:hypothetical protein